MSEGSEGLQNQTIDVLQMRAQSEREIWVSMTYDGDYSIRA